MSSGAELSFEGTEACESKSVRGRRVSTLSLVSLVSLIQRKLGELETLQCEHVSSHARVHNLDGYKIVRQQGNMAEGTSTAKLGLRFK